MPDIHAWLLSTAFVSVYILGYVLGVREARMHKDDK